MVTKILSILLTLSVAGNIVQIILGGVKITKNYDHRSFQNQSQSQLVVMLERKEGFVGWKVVKGSSKILSTILESLSSYQALFAKVECDGDNCLIVYPIISKDERFNLKSKGAKNETK